MTEYRLFVRTNDADLAHELEKIACNRGADESILQFCDEETKLALITSINIFAANGQIELTKEARRSLTLMEL